ncbi:hypothetical protein AOLI_G00137620 [Acnodon oligacanthus]
MIQKQPITANLVDDAATASLGLAAGRGRLFLRIIENPDGREPRSSATSAASTRPQRIPARQQMRQFSIDEREHSASDLAPTATALLNKEKQELTFLKENCLPSQEETLDNPVTVNDSESSDTSSMSSSSLSSSLSSRKSTRSFDSVYKQQVKLYATTNPSLKHYQKQRP